MNLNEVFRYPKINTLYKRDEKKKIIRDEYSSPIFKLIPIWYVFEKIDGCNVRIIYDSADKSLHIDSRNENELIPEALVILQEKFTIEKMVKVFPEENNSPSQVVLFGEAIGPRISKFGKKNLDEYDFYLFDVFIFDHSEKRRNIRGWWLNHPNNVKIAQALDIKRAPLLELMNIPEIVDFVEQGFNSQTTRHTTIAEGIVAKSQYDIIDREGNPIMFKLKASDFR